LRQSAADALSGALAARIICRPGQFDEHCGELRQNGSVASMILPKARLFRSLPQGMAIGGMAPQGPNRQAQKREGQHPEIGV